MYTSEWLTDSNGAHTGDYLPHYYSCGTYGGLMVKGAQSWYFELFWPHTKLPLNGRKPENNSLVR